MASESAITCGKSVENKVRMWIASTLPLNMESALSTMPLMFAGCGCEEGKRARVANSFTRVRTVSTAPQMASAQPRTISIELASGSVLRSKWRRMRSAESAMGVSGFLISCATRRATSRQAACFCARQQIGKIFENQYISNSFVLVLQSGDCDCDIQLRALNGELHLRGRGTHAVRAPQQVLQVLEDFGGEQIA